MLGGVGRRLFSSVATKTIKRNQSFSNLLDADIQEFQRILQSKHDVIEGEAELARYNQDWTKKYQGNCKLALRPSTTEQVSQILTYCNERRLAVVPQGGNTGLVGGGVPVFDELVLSLEKISKIITHDAVSGVLTVEAGCTLEAADNYVRDRGFVMPLDLGAKGSCMIGGNIATNAGGLRLLRYGSLHGNVLGLKVVLADGTILDGLDTCRKNNTGTDYKQLFIGSEGTLGIITAATILTPPLPQSTNVAIFSMKDYESIIQFFSQAKQDLGEILSAFEFWDSASQQLLDSHFPESRLPVTKAPFFVLVETSGSDGDHDNEKIMRFIEDVQRMGLIIDGTIAQDETQAKELWAFRENIPEACARSGIVYKYDVSLPTTKMYQPVPALQSRLKNLPEVKHVIGYGHFGDGNIHINIATNVYNAKVVAQIEPFIYEFISQHRGSISAEHGIGVMKSNYLSYSKSPAEIRLLQGLKDLLDPKGILNPYKVLPILWK